MTRARFVGELVLHDAPVQWHELQAPHDTILFNGYVSGARRIGPPDACWEFTEYPVNARLPHRQGLTHWLAASDSIQIHLFRSPDAWYVLHLRGGPDSLSGRGVYGRRAVRDSQCC